MITLITGGVKGGRSRYALRLAREHARNRCFVATAEPLDPDMAARIAEHKKARGPDFDTVEVPIDVPQAVERLADRYEVIVIDCLTLWLANLLSRYLEQPEEIERKVERLAEVLQSRDTHFVLVTNEVGFGVVPPNELSRLFVDALGRLNQKMAAIADEVVLVVSGIPTVLKGTVHAKLD